MAKPVKKISVSGAYGMWALGLLTGIFGLPRFYLRQPILGLAISTPFFVGVVMVFAEYAQFMSGTLNAATGILSGSTTDLAQLNSLQQGITSLTEQYTAFALMGIGVAIFVIELFLIPSACKAYHKEHKTYE